MFATEAQHDAVAWGGLCAGCHPVNTQKEKQESVQHALQAPWMESPGTPTGSVGLAVREQGPGLPTEYHEPVDLANPCSTQLPFLFGVFRSLGKPQ